MKKEDIWIEYANYKPQSLSRYQGNKFIEALPLKLGIEDFIATSIRDPEYKDSERFLPNSERCQAPFALKDWFMPTNNHVQLYDNIDLLIRNGYVERQKRSRSYPLPPAAAALIGVAGTGKSYGNMHVLNCYPDIIIHDTEKYPDLPRYQLPKLVITAPEDGDTKRIPELVYKALSMLLSEHLNIRINKYDDMKLWMKKFSVGMLVVEEIQFLLQLGVNNYDPVINALVSLCNELCVPLVFIGTMDIRKIFEGSLAQSRRVECTNMPYWLPFHRVATNTEQHPAGSLHPNFIEFMEEMWPYQWTQDKTELTADILEAFYDATAGIPDFMVKLFQLTQIQLMNDKEQEKRTDERITPQYIEDIANKYFDIAMPKIRAIRNRTPENLANYPDMDFTGLPEIQQLAKDLMIAPEERDQTSVKTIRKRMSRSKQIRMNLIGLNVQEEKARLYAEKVVLLHPGLHIKEQTRIALNMDAGEYKQNKQKTELKRIDISLLNEDINLLRQMHKNRTDTNTCHQQLMAAGIITDLREL